MRKKKMKSLPFPLQSRFNSTNPFEAFIVLAEMNFWFSATCSSFATIVFRPRFVGEYTHAIKIAQCYRIFLWASSTRPFSHSHSLSSSSICSSNHPRQANYRCYKIEMTMQNQFQVSRREWTENGNRKTFSTSVYVFLFTVIEMANWFSVMFDWSFLCRILHSRTLQYTHTFTKINCEHHEKY